MLIVEALSPTSGSSSAGWEAGPRTAMLDTLNPEVLGSLDSARRRKIGETSELSACNATFLKAPEMVTVSDALPTVSVRLAVSPLCLWALHHYRFGVWF